jgi:N-acetylglutamate synthase-like GNAT family acetyltransferase
MGSELRIEALGLHRDLIPLTVDWHMRWFDERGDRWRWLRARTDEARTYGVPCAWVAFHEGMPVGCVSLIASNMTSRPELTPWLAALFVLPPYRGRGIGAALVRRCEAEAKRCDHDRLFLYTSDASGYYERLGWREIEELTYEGQRVTVMMRQLPDAASSRIETIRPSASS